MNILVISHNVFSRTSAMGKTLSSYFERFPTDSIAQFYIHSEVPVRDDVCVRYFRFTDTDALKARLPWKEYGTVFDRADIQNGRRFSRTDSGLKARLYQRGRRRTAMIYFLRNLIWKSAFWKTEKYQKWVSDFRPDIVFFASGDYAFMYEIARYTADLANCPLVVSCMDDYYLKKGEQNWLSNLARASFMRDVCRTMKRADLLVCMCDEMSRAYAHMFHVEAHTLYTGVKAAADKSDGCGTQISYVGNIGALRLGALEEIGRALAAILERLKRARGIAFHGPVSADGVREVMKRSMLMVHVESMQDPEVNPARFSVSTKIAETLMNGPCLLAYGRGGLASVDYLQKHHAAYVITSKEKLKEGLQEIITHPELRSRILYNARELAQKNHTEQSVSACVSAYLEQAKENFIHERGGKA